MARLPAWTRTGSRRSSGRRNHGPVWSGMALGGKHRIARNVPRTADTSRKNKPVKQNMLRLHLGRPNAFGVGSSKVSAPEPVAAEP